MKTTIRSKHILLGLLFILSALPAQADGVGADYLMTHTNIDPMARGTRGKTAGKTKSGSLAQATPGGTGGDAAESTANFQTLPEQILKTGVSLNTSSLSPNARQVCDNINLTSELERITELRDRVAKLRSNDVSLDDLAIKQDLLDATQSARLTIHKTKLEVDFTVAEIAAELEVYNEILNTFKSDRDKALARTNALAFISNGVLWAITEAFVIPTYKHAIYNVPAGICGIPAGLVPSIASMYTFKQINGKKRTSEVEPNMLAKLFNYPINPEIDYPKSVWTFLNQVPADSPNSKKRLDQITDRWIADANMPAFTNRNSKKQLDVLTASVACSKGLTIASLTARTVMLDQLLSELNKMKRMLLEIDLVAIGDKHLIATKVQ